MSHVPELRFSEFASTSSAQVLGEWEERKIGEVFNIFNGYAFSSSDAQENGALWVKIADVGINKMKSDNLSFLPFDFLSKYKKFVLKEGDYVVALTRPILNDQLKIAQISHYFNNSLLNQRVGKIISNNCLGFVYALLQKPKLISHISNSIAGTDPPNLAPSSIRHLKISVPSLPEQQKIATFLSAVDKKLGHLRRKHELLESYKRGIMQKIFAQELRFKQDNGADFPDWEEKRLGDVAEIVGGGTPETSKNEYWGGDIQWFTPTEVKKKYLSDSKRTITEQGFLKSSAKKLPIGTLLLSTRATVGDVSIAQKECTTNQGFQSLIVNNNHINEFWYYWILNNKKILLRRSSGSTFLEISKKEIGKIDVSVPCKEEQQKIANFLSTLDKKLEAVQKQIDQTEVFKKGLLQKMFV